MIIYDIEIKKAILMKGEVAKSGIEYCDGFHDHKSMGISVINAYEWETGRYRCFMDDNMHLVPKVMEEHDIIVGFNNYNFDNRVLLASGVITLEQFQQIQAKTYDILQEIWKSVEDSTEYTEVFDYRVHAGYGLDACIKANLPTYGKTGHGALAPVDFQKGNFGNLIDYCLGDVWLTKMLLELILDHGLITNPKGGGVLHIDCKNINKYIL